MYTTVRHVIAHKGSLVHAVSPDATLDEVVALMGQHQIGAILVLEHERVLGIVTERECIAQVLWKRRFHGGSRVADIMCTNIPTVSPPESIQYCMQVMTKDRVRHLPVTDNGKLVGLISMGDVIHAQLSDQQRVIESLEQYISGSPSTEPPPPF
ncbi:MAG TPA: CBS domain-containing protein [Polyangiales bacterium]|nr:CBS domain-containing protein [Polyangiales bacterium]